MKLTIQDLIPIEYMIFHILVMFKHLLFLKQDIINLKYGEHKVELIQILTLLVEKADIVLVYIMEP